MNDSHGTRLSDTYDRLIRLNPLESSSNWQNDPRSETKTVTFSNIHVCCWKRYVTSRATRGMWRLKNNGKKIVPCLLMMLMHQTMHNCWCWDGVRGGEWSGVNEWSEKVVRLVHANQVPKWTKIALMVVKIYQSTDFLVLYSLEFVFSPLERAYSSRWILGRQEVEFQY